MCPHTNVVSTGYSDVCIMCGVETQRLVLDTFSENCLPLQNGYNRMARWCLKVNKLLGCHSGPQYSDPVWSYLEKHQSNMSTPADIRRYLRRATLRSKHYDSIRQFCACFTDVQVGCDVMRTKKFLIDSFEFVNSRWEAHHEKVFFSYCWLLRFFIKSVNSPLIIYLKPPTCARRGRKYELMFARIIRSRSTVGESCHGKPCDRSRCEKWEALIHQYRVHRRGGHGPVLSLRGGCL
jgi:hypothetical protein